MTTPAKTTAHAGARLMLLDTYGLVYRAFFALPPLTTTGGIPINAAYGFTMMLNRIIADEKPTHVIAVFDKGKPAERVALVPEYKAQRETMPDDLRSQFGLVRKVLQANRIPIAEMDGQEADDVIATLAAQAERERAETIVVTGDLDLLQIVDEHTMVLAQRRGITDMVRYDAHAVRERFELDPAQLPDYRGLKGDPSDNLPGIPGIGEKTAIKLMKSAGSLDALIAQPSLAGSDKLQRLIEQYADQARRCRDVSIANRSLRIEIDWEQAQYRTASNDDLWRLYSELEFKTMLAKLSPPAEMPLFANAARLEGSYESYVAIVDPPEFARLAQRIRELGSSEIALGLAGDAMSLTGKAGTGMSFLTSALADTNVAAALRSAIAGARRIVAYDAKSVAHALEHAQIRVPAFTDDAMIAAHLLNPSRSFAECADAASEFLLRSLPDDAAAIADAAWQIAEAARVELARRDQVRLYEDIELPLATVLAKMETIGVAVDPTELHVLSKEFDASIERVQQRIYDFAGETFNIGSPQQLGNILFTTLQIPSGKKTKTGWATGSEVLQPLASEYPICALVLEWREATKLKNTYVDVLPTLIDHNGRLHTVFNQTSTATGRLSSTNPNLQNIPIRTELGRRIRKAFVAPGDDTVLLTADYSQIELRLMAHLSGDEAMRRAFHEGQDIHDFTARQIFNVPGDGHADANQRRMAKAVNFGLLYGMSDFGLAQRLEIPRAQAKAISDAYFARFPSVRAFIERTLEAARRDGYVTTILGRRRYMPALTSTNYMLRSAAEREATNAPLQGSAADLMKLAMVNIDRAFSAEGLHARMLLQIHDELIFEVPRAELKATAARVRSLMEHALDLSVPLAVNVEVGKNWYDAQPYDEN